MLSSAARDAVFAALMVDEPEQTDTAFPSLAVSLRARLGAARALTPGERLTLSKLMDKLAG